MNKLNYYYTRETVRNCKQNGEHGSLLFVYVDSWWAMLFRIADRTRSREIVPLLSCTKNIEQHKSCLYSFQDVGNEVQLMLAHSATFSTTGNIKTMTIWAYLSRNTYHERHLPGPVSYWDFRETGPRAYKRQFTVFLDK